MLLFSVLAVLAGATSYQKIITFIAVQRDRLNTAFGACFRRAPGEIPAVPTLITELGLTGVLFTADALHCQKDAFTQAAEMPCWSR